MITPLLEKSQFIQNLIPTNTGYFLAEEVERSLLEAGFLGENPSIASRHFVATALVLKAVAISILMVIAYPFIAVYDFSITVLDQGFFDAITLLGKDLLHSLQSFALTAIGVIFAVIGIIYPSIYCTLVHKIESSDSHRTSPSLIEEELLSESPRELIAHVEPIKPATSYSKAVETIVLDSSPSILRISIDSNFSAPPSKKNKELNECPRALADIENDPIFQKASPSSVSILENQSDQNRSPSSENFIENPTDVPSLDSTLSSQDGYEGSNSTISSFDSPGSFHEQEMAFRLFEETTEESNDLNQCLFRLRSPSIEQRTPSNLAVTDLVDDAPLPLSWTIEQTNRHTERNLERLHTLSLIRSIDLGITDQETPFGSVHEDRDSPRHTPDISNMSKVLTTFSRQEVDRAPLPILTSPQSLSLEYSSLHYDVFYDQNQDVSKELPLISLEPTSPLAFRNISIIQEEVIDSSFGLASKSPLPIPRLNLSMLSLIQEEVVESSPNSPNGSSQEDMGCFELLDEEFDSSDKEVFEELDQSEIFDPELLRSIHTSEIIFAESDAIREEHQLLLESLSDFPQIFEQSTVLSELSKLRDFRTNLEVRSPLIYPKLRDLLLSVDSYLSKEALSFKEKKLIQLILTDLVIFSTYVPTQRTIDSYKSIDPFSPKNIEIFAQKILEKKKLSSHEYFNYYLEKGRSGPQKLLILSLLHLPKAIKNKVLKDPLFDKLLGSSQLEDVLLKTSGHLQQTSLFTCVAAAYTTRVLQKIPHITGLLHHTRSLLAISKTRLDKMTEEEKNEKAFNHNSPTKNAHVLSVIQAVEKELDAIHAKANENFSEDLIIRWNNITQQALTVIYPKSPSWFEEIMFSNHYHTSYAFSVIKSCVDLTGPWFSERRAQGGVPGRLIRQLPGPEGIEEQSFNYEVSSNTPYHEKLSKANALFHEILYQGFATFTFRITNGVLHANTLRACYIAAEPKFILFNPMDSEPRSFSIEEFVRFFDTLDSVSIGNIDV
ncbi:MAG: hypothetical protein FJZ56_04000 [Chlamydiae bacterium]|nr:hypothetical protein [Chlamydiota bacterium]